MSEGGFINMKSVKSAASCQSGLTFWSSLNGQPSLILFRFENGQKDVDDIYMLVTESKSRWHGPNMRFGLKTTKSVTDIK